MKIFDPLYGTFSLPEGFDRLVLAPEVRRLSAIRLLNTNSPTFATLGDLRRYSHTLGVLRLCMESKLDAYAKDEKLALLAAVLVHDVGTPPFGHLFELLIRERYGWDHESVALRILLGNSVPESSAHRIFGGRGVAFRKELGKVGVDESLVRAIVSKQHPLSRLIFGSLDFDNLDNVTRMAWALGIEGRPSDTLTLARELNVAESGELLLRRECAGHVEQWLTVRESVYKLLVFDNETVAAQAILADAMASALDADELGPEDWSLTDEDCLARLRACKSVDQKRLDLFFGVLPSLSMGIQVRSGTPLDGLTNTEILDHICCASERMCGERGLAYLARDKRTFSRLLRFTDPSSAECWTVGQDTSSLILYHFSDAPGRARATGNAMLREFIEKTGLQFGDIIKYSVGHAWESLDEQRSFNLSP